MLSGKFSMKSALSAIKRFVGLTEKKKNQIENKFDPKKDTRNRNRFNRKKSIKM